MALCRSSPLLLAILWACLPGVTPAQQAAPAEAPRPGVAAVQRAAEAPEQGVAARQQAVPARQPAGRTPSRTTSADALGEITVNGRRFSDEALSTEVAAALHSDSYLDDAHVTVTTRDGVVTLHGFVQDAWDLLALRRVARKVAGSKKIVNDVELMLNDQ